MGHQDYNKCNEAIFQVLYYVPHIISFIDIEFFAIVDPFDFFSIIQEPIGTNLHVSTSPFVYRCNKYVYQFEEYLC